MIINKTKWHYKWYRWFRGGEPDQTNLCPYARTVFLWTPLKFLFAKGFIKKVPVPAVIYPVLLFEIPRWIGMFSYNGKISLYLVYLFLTGLVAAITSIVGTAKLTTYLGDKSLRSKMSDDEWSYFTYMDKNKKYLPERLKKEPFKNKLIRLSNAIQSSLIWNYGKALHDKVCPIIRFE